MDVCLQEVNLKENQTEKERDDKIGFRSVHTYGGAEESKDVDSEPVITSLFLTFQTAALQPLCFKTTTCKN